LLENQHDTAVKIFMKESVFELTGKSGIRITLNDQVYQTIKVQLMALGLVDVQYSPTVQGGMALFWFLTPKGQEILFQYRTVKKK
jgi:hypothetical protein